MFAFPGKKGNCEFNFCVCTWLYVVCTWLTHLLRSFNSLHPRVRKRNFPFNDDNVAFMQQVHSKTTGKRSVLLIGQLHSTTELRLKHTFIMRLVASIKKLSVPKQGRFPCFRAFAAAGSRARQLEQKRGQSLFPSAF